MAATDRVVVDAGVILALVLPEKPEARAYAVALMRDASVTLVVPELAHIEAAAVLARRVRAGVITEDHVRLVFDVLDRAETIETRFDVRQFYRDAMEIGCQVGDAVYVRLAQDYGAKVAALDGGTKQGARALRLPLYAA